MLGIKTENGRKGCIIWSSIIYAAPQILGYQRTVAKWVRNVACMGVTYLKEISDWKMGKEGVHSEGLCEYGGIILKWILRNCIRMDFDYSYIGRALNDIPMNSLMNRKFYKILWNILISWATNGISGNAVSWMCLFYDQ